MSKRVNDLEGIKLTLRAISNAVASMEMTVCEALEDARGEAFNALTPPADDVEIIYDLTPRAYECTCCGRPEVKLRGDVCEVCR